jgi:hypothetical protein
MHSDQAILEDANTVQICASDASLRSRRVTTLVWADVSSGLPGSDPGSMHLLSGASTDGEA